MLLPLTVALAPGRIAARLRRGRLVATAPFITRPISARVLLSTCMPDDAGRMSSWPVMASTPMRAKVLVSTFAFTLLPAVMACSVVSSNRLLRSTTPVLPDRLAPVPTMRTARPSMVMYWRFDSSMPVGSWLASTGLLGALESGIHAYRVLPALSKCHSPAESSIHSCPSR